MTHFGPTDLGLLVAVSNVNVWSFASSRKWLSVPVPACDAA